MNRKTMWQVTAGVLATVCSLQFAWAAQPGLPPNQHAGAITYLSGGVGSDQSAAIKEAMHNYPLTLEFVGMTHDGNEYLADIPVRIADTHGNNVLKANANGPFMLLSLPQGHYTITATHDGKTEQRAVNIASATHAREMFTWPM
ncbi:MAG: carboxypeptidase regulatory-like domain-containing protein [Paraburkholderia sp.]|jgi:hypothetical protein|uniref:carboxypeptidase-like regulatory domain-containing protein n=1 Tax=Burkholderiaceae TaxID=119060 RepID=UPI0010F7A5F6|nr:carboxypeptidase-like regulatory domain-containing protein [Burkholderia sp. 4M9327F10]